MSFQINRENGIVNRGNLYRLKQLMQRAERGEEITLGFLGGSITQGSLSTKPELCYAYLVYDWWKKTFPQTKFNYVNAGIGGTTSQFGVARVQSDLLEYAPDFVITEFSVNDESNEHFLETYEGLIRKIYASKTAPAMLIVHNVYYNNGANAQLQHAKVGRYYQIPCVSMQSSIYPEVLAGKIENRKITPDDLHPNDAGHALVASVIAYFLEKVYKEMNMPEEEPVGLPKAFTPNAYEQSLRYRNNNCIPAYRGFIKDERTQNGITDCFKNGWEATEKGASIVFEIEGTGVAVQYRKTIKKPAPIAEVVVDNDYENAVRLDANFDEDWGDKLELDTITEHMPYAKHRVEIKIIETHPEDVTSFYLVSVIGTGRSGA